jgi:hypothetical protein
MDQMSALKRAERKLGFARPNEFSQRFRPEEEADLIRKKIVTESDTAKKEVERGIEAIEEIDPIKAQELRTDINETRDIASIMGRAEIAGEKATKPAILEKTIPAIGRVTGKIVRDKVDKPAEVMARGMDRLADATPEAITRLSNKLRERGSDTYARAVNKLNELEGSSRTAAIFGLMQQPGFRELLLNEDSEEE